jgi:hypothetical protein
MLRVDDRNRQPGNAGEQPGDALPGGAQSGAENRSSRIAAG